MILQFEGKSRLKFICICQLWFLQSFCFGRSFVNYEELVFPLSGVLSLCKSFPFHEQLSLRIVNLVELLVLLVPLPSMPLSFLCPWIPLAITDGAFMVWWSGAWPDDGSSFRTSLSCSSFNLCCCFDAFFMFNNGHILKVKCQINKWISFNETALKFIDFTKKQETNP